MFAKVPNKMLLYFSLALVLSFFSGCAGLGGLHSAAIKGDVAMTRELVSQNADINERSSLILNKNTPLILAAMHNNDDVAKILIENGANVNAQNSLGWSALMYAARNGKVDVVKLLVARGADVNAKNFEGKCPLYFAAFNGREQTSKHLIENGADVNTADYLGFTPLMVAAMKGYYVIVDYFLQKGAEVNAKNISGNTALIIAVDHQRQKTTENLIKAGADVNYSGDTALKPLFYASRHGTKFYVDILLNAGADINAKSNESITPLFMAITFGRELLAEEYLGRGAVFYPVNVGPVDIYHTAMCYQFAANYYQKQAETQKAKDNFQLAIKYFNDAIPALKAHSRKLWWSGVLISTTPQGQQSSSNDFALSAEIDEYIKKSQDNIAECQQKLAVL